MTWVSALDQILSYYTMTMKKRVRSMLTIILPFGKYQHAKMPMGLTISTDVFQREMSKLFEGIDFVLVYIDDIFIVTKSTFEDHLLKLRKVLIKLCTKVVQLNAKKTFLCAKEVEHLVYIITREGSKPQPKKVQAIINMDIPKIVQQLRGVVGLVKFYRDLWKRRAHLLAPLTSLIDKKKGTVKWNEEAEKSFSEIKRICAENVLLHYHEFNEEFEIYTDASKYQMGGIITQKGKVIAYWSKKLSSAQTKYPTIEQELLAIAEILKDFRNILLGHKITVRTDHINLTFDITKFSCDRVLRQRLKIEEYGPTISHIDGNSNIVADTLSRNSIMEEQQDVEAYIRGNEIAEQQKVCMTNEQ